MKFRLIERLWKSDSIELEAETLTECIAKIAEDKRLPIEQRSFEFVVAMLESIKDEVVFKRYGIHYSIVSIS